jgi:DNA-binding CsgD family transcriptional regulator
MHFARPHGRGAQILRSAPNEGQTRSHRRRFPLLRWLGDYLHSPKLSRRNWRSKKKLHASQQNDPAPEGPVIVDDVIQRLQLLETGNARLESKTSLLDFMKSRAFPTTPATLLEQGCESFRKQAWADAFYQLSTAEGEEALQPEHLVLLAQAAILIGKEAEGAEILARAHQGFLNHGAIRPAVRCAFWLGFSALLNGEAARGGGWLSRANRLLENESDCVERGYLLLPAGFGAFRKGDSETAYRAFQEAAAIAQRFSDKDLMTLALQGQGRALIRQGEVARGLGLLDEAMVAVTAGEVSPLNAGGVYCSVLEACGEIFDLQRAHEWTSALKRWCESQPDIVPYRGACLVRRAELLRLKGAWPDALEEAERACEWLSQPSSKPAVGAAFYQLGEIHRVRGNLTEAEKAYEAANQWMPNLGPGLPRLRLAQRQVEAAFSSIRRMAEEVQEPSRRAVILDAYVEISLAQNDLPSADHASEELTAIAQQSKVAFLRALASRCAGAVSLARGDAASALGQLRESWNLWCELQVPYEGARVRCMIAQAFRKMGDDESAVLEFSSARRIFEELGASADLACLNAILREDVGQKFGPLTGREREVLRLVASGMTNRSIAQKLNISEKTVARHLSNMFTKLDLDSRTAATAYAYEHNLI